MNKFFRIHNYAKVEPVTECSRFRQGPSTAATFTILQFPDPECPDATRVASLSHEFCTDFHRMYRAYGKLQRGSVVVYRADTESKSLDRASAFL